MTRIKIVSLALWMGLVSHLFTYSDQMVEIECAIKPLAKKTFRPRKLFSAPQAVDSDWSGYVAAIDLKSSDFSSGTVSYVAGAWVVPLLAPTPDFSYCSISVGMDGYTNNAVEQIGTAHKWARGWQHDYVWFEIYPNGPFQLVGFPLSPGDLMSARVAYKGNDTFKLVIFNHTKGVSVTIPYSFTTTSNSLRSSAEWVVETPFSWAALPLADFQKITFNYCSAVINGIHGLVNDGNWMNVGVVRKKHHVTEAKPTELLKDGSCFQVLWKSK